MWRDLRFRGIVPHSRAGLASELRDQVMFGSLARDEVTAGSDLDWTLLIDGQSDTQHLAVTKAIKVLVEKTTSRPGRRLCSERWRSVTSSFT